MALARCWPRLSSVAATFEVTTRAGCASLGAGRKSSASCSSRAASAVRTITGTAFPLQLSRDLPDRGDRETVVGFSVRPHDGADDAPLLQVPEPGLADRGIHREDIALGVKVLAQVPGCRHARAAAEIIFRQDRDLAGRLRG